MQAMDCLIVGAGPAGLVAALYLARFRRRVMVVDSGRSRAALIPACHNFPGFPDGVAGTALLQLLTRQVERHGAAVTPGRVTRLGLDGHGGFVAATTAGERRAACVLLATGSVDLTPPWPTAADAVRGGFLRYCPVCDGFEVIDREVGVLGQGGHGLREALFLRGFTSRLTLFTDGPGHLDAGGRERLAAAGVALEESPLRPGVVEAGGFACRLRDGRVRRLDSLYVALGSRMRSGLARRLGAARSARGELIVDSHMQTTVPGLYAAGDVVLSLNQMAVAVGQAAIAATAIHNRLREREREGRR